MDYSVAENRQGLRYGTIRYRTDADADGKQVVMPYDKREVKPIPYYASGTQPTVVDYGHGAVVEGRYLRTVTDTDTEA